MQELTIFTSMVCCRKDLCEARPKMQCVFKISDVLFALNQMDPPIVEASAKVDIFDKCLGQADLWSDEPPIGEALGQVDILSGFGSG